MSVPGLGPLSLSGFESPGWLLLLAAPVVLLVAYVVAAVHRRRRLARFVPSQPAALRQPRAPRLRHVAAALLLLALVPLTLAIAQPSQDIRVPRNRAVVMLAIDVSRSMGATDVSPTRLQAAEKAAADYAGHVTPGVNLGLISFAGSAAVLVAPNPDHQLTIDALDKLQLADSTATGQAIFAALQSIQTVNAVLQGPRDQTPPARIVVLSDGEENHPANPDAPQGAYTAARAAREAGVPITTISFGTPQGHVEMGNQSIPVPVGQTMTTIARLSGGQTSSAANVDDLNQAFEKVDDQLGYQTERGPASTGWLRLSAVLAFAGALLALLVGRRLPA
ncbi:VWA domain-containing protein [Mycolicibacterium sp. 018/SC-01/001]|uniref:VWA domain-containing protein n=1 Tax=Mycolicibacterium sp. 018/SC-01/001 TaxID=2592069 RepID=UPI00118146B2|nr:VWA domain-containing protein [Mycolicibacterium sp. 018/SC-01/001]TRW82786.1 VWA domain-containing protein [Mycolicibacterium sp. 018/SC-01/001]